MNKSRNHIILIVICVLIAAISFFEVSKLAASPDTYKQTISSLEEKKAMITEITMVTAGTATALAAIPGDATTPIANELVDLSGYLIVVTALIVLEKYLLTLTGLLTFKILIPLACGFLVIYLISQKQLLKKIAIRFILFGIAIVFVIPVSVSVSNIIEETYQIQSEYSLEKAYDDQTEIQTKSENKNFLERVTSKVSNGLDAVVKKGKNMLSHFTEYIAVMLVVNLAIPILILMLFIWLLKCFFGINIKLPKPTKKPHELIRKKGEKSTADTIDSTCKHDC